MPRRLATVQCRKIDVNMQECVCLKEVNGRYRKGKSEMARQRKYQPELLIKMFRKAASLRNDMLEAGFTDNGGAIHSAERILNILGLSLKYPDISHISNVRHSKSAVFSMEALELHQSGGKVFIEHVSPLRHLTQTAIEKIGEQMSDTQFEAFIREHYILVLLSPDETKRLNKQNRSRMNPDRLENAGIQLATAGMESKAVPNETKPQPL